MTSATKHIALVCPGGPITEDLAAQIDKIAAARHGDAVKLHFNPQCFFTSGHFAGSDAERSAAFLEAANDPQYDAVWFARGGYGAGRIADAFFPQLTAAAGRKIYLGYSDAAMLLARLYKLGLGRPAHGPMPTDLNRPNGETAIARALDYLVSEDEKTLEASARTATAPQLAFNITVLAHLIAAADWAPDFSGHELLLEDVGEYLYRIDRAMFAITAHPGVQRAAGIRLGRISDVPENDRPFGQTEEEIVRYWCAKRGIAYLGRADIGHDADNKIVPFGDGALA